MNQVESKGLDINGAEVKFIVKKPSPKNLRDGELTYNKTVREALSQGSLLRQKLNDYLVEQQIWNDVKEAEYKKLIKDISDCEELIKRGGVKLSVGKEAAIKLRSLRGQLRDLVQERQSYDTMTAEGQGDNARFNYLVSVCVFKEDGKTPMWSSVAEYDDCRDPYAMEAASALAKILYDLDPDYDSKLPENQFLKKFKFVRDDLKLVNKDGHLIDEDGRLINEDGRFVAYRSDGTQYFVNRDGQEISESGEKVIEHMPFLDDDGNPIVEDAETPTEPVT